MRNKSRLIKGPRATAADYEANRERMQIRRDAESRDRAELAEYAEAMRSGNEARALEIALARQARSRARLYPQGIIESEAARQAGATDPLLAAPQTQVSASPAPFAVGVSVYHKHTYETGKLVELRRHTNNSPRWVVQFDNGKRELVWQVDLRTGTPPAERPPQRKMQPSYYGRRHGADGKFIDRKFAAQVDAIAQRIRDARDARESEGGAT
jgi:hypothetical protein